MDLMSSDRLSPSNHLSYLSLMWLKEDDFLLVSRKRLHEWLETMAIDFETPNAVGIE